MQIKLLSATPLKYIYESILISSGNTPSTKPRNDQQIKEFIEKLYKILGHESVLELANFSFIIKDISRLALESVEHHRLVSYNEKSFRRPHKEFSFYKNFGKELLQKYYQRIEKGEKSEEARGSLPLSLLTDVAISINGRSLYKMIQNLSSSKLEEVKILGEELNKIFEKYLGFKVSSLDGIWSPYYYMLNDYPADFKIERFDTIVPQNYKRLKEFQEFTISGQLSNYSIAQLRRHRIGTLLLKSPSGLDEEYSNYTTILARKRSFLWKTNRRSLENFIYLRDSKHAQKEIQEFAKLLKNYL